MTVNLCKGFCLFFQMRQEWLWRVALSTAALALISASFTAAQTKTPTQPIQSSAPPASATSAQPPTQDYLVYVVCESADKVVLVRFGPKGLQIGHETRIGLMPMDINGPHGIAVSPDKQFLYVSVGHGRPDGSVWKLKTGTDEVIRFAPLGLFPATTDISRDGAFHLRSQRKFPRRHGSLFDIRGSHRRNGGSKAHHHLHHAARLAPESARNQTLFRLHDGRHARRN